MILAVKDRLSSRRVFILAGLDKPLGFVSKSTFPLHVLGSVLSEIAREVHNGRGFSMVRGIPVDLYSREDVMIIYAGVSSYIGNLRGIFDPNGTVVGHVADLSAVYGKGAIGAPAYTADPQVRPCPPFAMSFLDLEL